MYTDFYQNYLEEKFEATILVKEVLGMGHVGNYGEMSARVLAMVLADGQLIDHQITLNWPTSWENPHTSEGFERLKALEMFKVELSAHIIDPDKMNGDQQEYFKNSYCLRTVLERNISEPKLIPFKEEFLTEVSVNDPHLGKLVLEKTIDMFTNECNWLDENCLLYLETDEDDGKTCNAALAFAHTMFNDQQNFDEAMRSFACDNLLDDANSWIEDDDEQSKLYPDGLSREDFIKRISLSELSIDSDGSYSAYYDDDDIFWGHVIIVEGSISDRSFSQSYIAG